METIKFFNKLLFLLSLICLFETGLSQDILTSYEEHFDQAINFDLWNPNPATHEDGSLVFDISQEDGILNIITNQVHFYDGLFFNFTAYENIIFDITNAPYIAIDVKIEPGATYGGIEVDSVAFTVSVWGQTENGSLQREFESISKYAPDDGEWHTLVYEILPTCYITIPCDFEENYTEIEAVLLESKWPDTYVYNMQMDVFRIGEAAAEFIPLISVDTYSNNLNLSTRLFPNPVFNELIVKAEEDIKLIRIFDLQGKLIAMHPIDQLRTVTIDFSTYAKGMYLLETRNATKISRTKVFKQ